MKVNREIRAPRVRVIGQNGEQVGIVALYEALAMAEAAGLDLVEVVPGASPPVCKIINYGKFRYDLTKREKESKKSQHQIKVKEVKFKPNIDEHDFQTKVRNARKFLEEGNKVKLTLTFRGREMAHTDIGERLVKEVIEGLEDVGTAESIPKMMGRMLNVVVSPGAKKKKSSESAPTPIPKPQTGVAQGGS